MSLVGTLKVDARLQSKTLIFCPFHLPSSNWLTDAYLNICAGFPRVLQPAVKHFSAWGLRIEDTMQYILRLDRECRSRKRSAASKSRRILCSDSSRILGSFKWRVIHGTRPTFPSHMVQRCPLVQGVDRAEIEVIDVENNSSLSRSVLQLSRYLQATLRRYSR